MSTSRSNRKARPPKEWGMGETVAFSGVGVFTVAFVTFGVAVAIGLAAWLAFTQPEEKDDGRDGR